MKSDIERNRNLVRISQSKGLKDKIVLVTDCTIEMIDAYIFRYKPVRFLFKGQ